MLFPSSDSSLWDTERGEGSDSPDSLSLSLLGSPSPPRRTARPAAAPKLLVPIPCPSSAIHDLRLCLAVLRLTRLAEERRGWTRGGGCEAEGMGWEICEVLREVEGEGEEGREKESEEERRRRVRRKLGRRFGAAAFTWPPLCCLPSIPLTRPSCPLTALPSLSPADSADSSLILHASPPSASSPAPSSCCSSSKCSETGLG